MGYGELEALPAGASEGLKAELSSGNSKFKLAYIRITEEMCREFGATNSQVAAVLGVTSMTVRDWARRVPEFREAIGKGRADADSKVERALFERAIGCKVPAQKVFCNKDGESTVVDYEEFYPPDPTCIALWLKNRLKDEWNQADRVEVSGAAGAPLPVINITLNAGIKQQVATVLPAPAVELPVEEGSRPRIKQRSQREHKNLIVAAQKPPIVEIGGVASALKKPPEVDEAGIKDFFSAEEDFGDG